MASKGPIRNLKRHYKSNPGFREWVKANEQWIRQNPEVFNQMASNPNMMNLFMDLMVMNSDRIQRKLGRSNKK